MANHLKLITIDSFCGVGGTTEGFHRAKVNGHYVVAVLFGINHDAVAIANHSRNHPETVHFVEDFRTLDPALMLPQIELARKQNPGAKLHFHMSAECTHHSKAKGGESRDADSRSLPEYIYKYIEILRPDIITVENVVEFIDWGPLQIKVKTDKKGNELYCPLNIKKNKKTKVVEIGPKWVPVKERKGEYYELWKEAVESYGYHYQYRKLNAADYGAFTSRTRYFGVFALDPKNIAWPVKTHAKNGAGGLKRWNAVKNVLDLTDEGISIFDREKDLVDNTLERIYAGLMKFVAEGKWMLKYNSVNGKNGRHVPPGIDEPCPTVACQDRLGLVQTKFIQTYYGNGGTTTIDEPCPTITTHDRCALVDAKFICSYNYKDKSRSIDQPCPTLLTKDRYALANVHFVDQQYGKSKPVPVEQPVGALTTNPKYNLVSAESRWLMDTNFSNVGSALEAPSPVITANHKYHYLVNPQFNSAGGSIEKPCFTLIARMDKRPPGMVTARSDFDNLPSFIRADGDTLVYDIYDTDSEILKRIKEFMAAHGITDILMRMLRIDELLRIMGFGDSYVLKGTQTEKKKFIGNAVECHQAQVLAEAIAKTI
ncbi:MAG: DNA cytosine methyltransferase [Prolixibacteraceae bacterium]